MARNICASLMLSAARTLIVDPPETKRLTRLKGILATEVVDHAPHFMIRLNAFGDEVARCVIAGREGTAQRGGALRRKALGQIVRGR